MKLYISPTEFVEIDKDREVLTSDIAIRSRAMDWWGMFGYLPDPDPVLAKLGLGVEVYRELLTDAHVWSCYDSRKSGALSCEWEVRAGSDSTADKRALKIAEESLANLDIYQVIMEMLDAPFFGLSPLEITWAYKDRQWLPSKLEGKPPEWFVFDDENRMRFLSASEMINGELLPHGKFLMARHHATYQNPYGERVLSRCFWPVAFKRGGFQFWSIFTEKFGMPWLIGKVPRGTNEADRMKLRSNLIQMVQDAVAVINNDESISSLEFQSKGASADIYEQLISACNREISKAVLGQTLSTELDKGGSWAATKEHMEVRADIVEKDKRMVRTAMNRFLSWITELNVPDAASPEFAWFEEDDVQQDRAARDTELTNQGVKFTATYYQRTYNLEEDDFTLEASGATASAEFAEDASPQIPDADPVDQLAANLDKEAAPLVENLVEPVRDLVMSVDSLEEISEKIPDLYPDMDAGDLGALIQQATAAAMLAGRYDVTEGN